MCCNMHCPANRGSICRITETAVANLHLHLPPIQRIDTAGERIHEDLRRLRFWGIEDVWRVIIVAISAAAQALTSSVTELFRR